MANLAICPQCTQQLSLPDTAGPSALLECPECQATFLLSQAVQQSLPAARLVELTAPQPTVSELPAAPTDGSPALQSWEQRLKKAIATDQTTATVGEGDAADEADQSPKTAASTMPNFEFELDLPSAESPKKSSLNFNLSDALATEPSSDALQPNVEPAGSTAKTLADFAAQLDGRSEDQASPFAEAVEVAADSDQMEQSAEEVDAEQPKEVAIQAAPRQQASKRRLPKVLAFAIGPVVGSLLGLYGLLWLQGTRADYLGLARVLPASMLPTSMLPADLGTAKSEAALALEKSSDGAALPEAGETIAPVRRDEEVTLASAVEPAVVKQRSWTVSAEEFAALVDEAIAALPDMLRGDLSDRESLRRKCQAYVVLCRLAEQIDFASQPGLAPSLQTTANQALQVFQQAAVSSIVRRDLGQIVSRWWKYGDRPNAGIFLVGSVQSREFVGDKTIAWLQVGDPSAPLSIPVLLQEQSLGQGTDAEVGDQMTVVGDLITRADEIPTGFDGQQIVRSRIRFTLPAAQ